MGKGKNKLVFWFEEVGQEHNDIVGKKGANLGEMSRLNMPVAPGFAIPTDAYRRFMDETGVGEKISKYIISLGKININQCEDASKVIRSMVEEKEIPSYIKEEICSCYDALSDRVQIQDVPVSVRSGAPASRPGLFETYLNVRGKEEVLLQVRKVWSSAFTGRAMWYRFVHDIPLDSDVLGVVVQKLVNARSAGITFTADPVTGDRSRIIVEASWGMGEGVVSDRVRVDGFVINKETMEVIERDIREKTFCIACGREGGIEEKDIPVDKRLVQCLSEQEIKEIARLSKLLEECLGQPQDIEWAIDPDLPFPNNIYFFQTRPEKFATGKAQSPMDRLLDIMAKRALTP
jgi:pyruvate,water dikinase